MDNIFSYIMVRMTCLRVYIYKRGGHFMKQLLKETVNAAGEKVYQMATFDINVKARMNGGLAPTIHYFLNDRDITDDIRALRYHPDDPSSFIVDFKEFQRVLYEKEIEAITKLYDKFSIRPKNMPESLQVIWSFSFLFCIVIVFMSLAKIMS